MSAIRSLDNSLSIISYSFHGVPMILSFDFDAIFYLNNSQLQMMNLRLIAWGESKTLKYISADDSHFLSKLTWLSQHASPNGGEAAERTFRLYSVRKVGLSQFNNLHRKVSWDGKSFLGSFLDNERGWENSRFEFLKRLSKKRLVIEFTGLFTYNMTIKNAL